MPTTRDSSMSSSSRELCLYPRRMIGGRQLSIGPRFITQRMSKRRRPTAPHDRATAYRVTNPRQSDSAINPLELSARFERMDARVGEASPRAHPIPLPNPYRLLRRPRHGPHLGHLLQDDAHLRERHLVGLLKLRQCWIE